MFDLEQQAYDLGYDLDDVPVRDLPEPKAAPIVQPGFQLPASIWKLMGACYFVFFSAMIGLAAGSAFALFMVVIAALYTLMFFATGSVLAALPGRLGRSPLDEGKPLPTWTGPMGRGAVMGQVLIVPFGIALFGTAVMLVSWWV